MSYSLRSTGLASNLVMCVAVDQDGTTVKDFASSAVSADMTVNGNVTVSSATWKGTSRGYFQTKTNGATDYYGVTFGTHKPVVNAGSPNSFAIFIAVAGMDGGTNISAILEAVSSGSYLALRNASSKFGTPWHSGVTAMPSDGTTKFSVAINHEAFVDFTAYYALETTTGSNTIADATGSDAGFGGNGTNIYGIGGATGQGNQPAKYHIVAIFNRDITLSEYRDLHDDWFGKLFTTAAGQELLFGVRDFSTGQGTMTSSRTISL